MTVTYRDPWEWLESLITDPIFAKKINWYPCRKYLHENGSRVRLYDDLETGDNWWNYQTDISPQAEPIPRCYLPIHFWSDKAKVSNQYSMHPVLMRPGFLPSVIRNGNGNGGGVLMAYLPLPDLEDEASLDEASANKRAIIKRMMYHASIKVLLASLRGPSHHGKIVCCGDSVVRICHPGILAYSMDYEEATYALLNRGVNAHFPDPKSNVPNEMQNDLSWIFSRRTTEEMTAAYKRSRECRFAYQMLEVLQSFGTYPIKNSFWDIRNSSLYLGWLYDVLHMDDTSGKGKKIFLLIVEILKAARKEFSESPSYPQLKHFDRVTDISYTDGNTIFNIIKNLVFCIVDLMPLNSPWVHLVRAYTRFRVLIGLRVMTDTRIALGKKLLEIYDYWAHVRYPYCDELLTSNIVYLLKKVYQQERLSLDYPKHSACRHVFDDIRSAGVTSNYVTKHGESYNAEMKASHNQTNFKDVEKQMWKIDQNHEVLAHMMDGILLHNEMEEAQFAQELADHQEVDPEQGAESEASYSGNAHHRLGSKVSRMQTMNEFEASNAETNGIKDLLSFYRCAYINYESKEDFRIRRDIIRCNPSFNGHPRYDTVLVDDTPLRFARVLAIFDWKFHRSSPPLAMALVRYFQPATWTPRTKFERCRVLRERSDTHFIYMSSIIRSCHMPRAFGKDGHYFVNDQTDGDIFLRLEETAI
ncbi:hypothetical protein SISNIDRAFT_407226 [Sistotremastrum niveocremeum HHB9708]|uniref:Uncharacterized protein n=1 Tax=Sistotremastrum niveocremeum HHB9708 TaxID=1314777 RepID=A0A164XTU4_9AGAM|nr:hypothetical protein SISNIDRAFT_407226 [Sistotremastrum niveocremeum HHB9708]